MKETNLVTQSDFLKTAEIFLGEHIGTERSNEFNDINVPIKTGFKMRKKQLDFHLFFYYRQIEKYNWFKKVIDEFKDMIMDMNSKIPNFVNKHFRIFRKYNYDRRTVREIFILEMTEQAWSYIIQKYDYDNEYIRQAFLETTINKELKKKELDDLYKVCEGMYK